ncbi:MAG: FAD-binding oxidoreductase [Burkholderiaceae bacterium]|nr:FAD-binding oxidoreductase [Burkholderiaceae bacterium]
MPNPQLTKPWHGVPREQIAWNPTILDEACIGCGTCVTGCSRLVYRFDYVRKKAVVVDPLNCMVGCTTCANTCPSHAIAFPLLDTVFALEARSEVRHAVEDELIARRAELSFAEKIPHPDRIVELRVEAIARPSPDVVELRLVPVVAGECFCEFAPGQYIELWMPDSAYMSRAYSIANAPRGHGAIELQIRRVAGGRLSQWVHEHLREGDHVRARGPLGSFTMRTPVDRPLIFVAGGTGFAPIEALIEQQLKLAPTRDMLLVWGAASLRDIYAMDRIESWSRRHPSGLRIVLAAERDARAFSVPVGVTVVEGNVADALRASPAPIAACDAYVAGPPAMIRAVLDVLHGAGLTPEQIHVDAFGAA